MRGSFVESDDQLATAPLGEVLAEAPIDSRDFVLELTGVQPAPGDWIYPIVYESLYAPGMSEEMKQTVDELAQKAVQMTGEVSIATLFINYVDIDQILNPEECDSADWDPMMLQCLPLAFNDTPTTTFFVPDFLERALNAVRETEGPSQWCLGAIGSAVRFVAQ